jgi:tetratricopeptide (TPR) repeat protein
MRSFGKLFLLAGLGGLMLAAGGCRQLEARDQLNRGVANFKAAQFNLAIENFQDAIRLDPTLIDAKLYLATAYQSQFTPGAPSLDNLKMAQNAMDEYQKVLQQDPKNANAVAGLGRLNYDMGNLEAARKFYSRQIEIQPSDPTAYYTLGAIDYQETNKGIMTARQSLGITDINAPLIGKKSKPAERKMCQDLATQDLGKINDGIQQLDKALELRSDYADAMTYLNLLYREKADLTCGNDADRQADLKIANDFVSRSLAVRKAQVAAQNKQTGPVVTAH